MSAVLIYPGMILVSMHRERLNPMGFEGAKYYGRLLLKSMGANICGKLLSFCFD